MHVIGIIGAALALTTLCCAQDFQYNKIVGVSEGQTCTPLPNPEHGHFRCKVTTYGEECELRCQPGYVPPITYTPRNKLMAVDKRGTYRCLRVPGGLSWVPDVLFDCVERSVPQHFILHYAVSMPVKCNPGSNIENVRTKVSNQLDRSELMKECRKVHKRCSYQLYMVCTGTSFEADLELYIPLEESIADEFPDIRKKLDDASKKPNGLKNVWKRVNQTEAAQVMAASFFMDCPRGTRLEGDITCRGCSRGFFLDLATSECVPCPQGTYQDQNLRDYCVPCPEGAFREQDGLRDRLHCFFSGTYMEYTNIETVLKAMFCVVVVFTAIMAYRRTVTNEPGPDSVEKDPMAALLPPKIDLGDKEAVAGSEYASGDFSQQGNAAQTDAQAVLLAAGLPLEAPITTKAGWRTRAKERLQMTLEMTLLRRTGAKPAEVPKAPLGDEGDDELVVEQEEPPPSGAKTWLRGRLTKVLRRKAPTENKKPIESIGSKQNSVT